MILESLKKRPKKKLIFDENPQKDVAKNKATTLNAPVRKNKFQGTHHPPTSHGKRANQSQQPYTAPYCPGLALAGTHQGDQRDRKREKRETRGACFALRLHLHSPLYRTC